MTTSLLSVVLPAYNEQEVLPLTYERFAAMRSQLSALDVDFELVFVNDGSRDATPRILAQIAERDEGVRVVNLTRNFGHQAAVTAGLSVARGDAVAVMDCDLQDPPEMLPAFLEPGARATRSSTPCARSARNGSASASRTGRSTACSRDQ